MIWRLSIGVGHGPADDWILLLNTSNIKVAIPSKFHYTDDHGNRMEISVGNQNDNELPWLMKYLLLLKDEPNVREIEKRNWRLEVGYKND